jgi:hypothetical protein
MLRIISVFLILLATQTRAADVEEAAQAFRAGLTSALGTLVRGGWQGLDSAVTRRSVERITDAASWNSAWRRNAPGGTVPEVEFSTDMVIAIFPGELGASRLRLRDIADAAEIAITLDIEILTDISIGGVIKPTVTPFMFVVLPRSQKPVLVTARSWGIINPESYSTIGVIPVAGENK